MITYRVELNKSGKCVFESNKVVLDDLGTLLEEHIGHKELRVSCILNDVIEHNGAACNCGEIGVHYIIAKNTDDNNIVGYYFPEKTTVSHNESKKR